MESEKLRDFNKFSDDESAVPSFASSRRDSDSSNSSHRPMLTQDILSSPLQSRQIRHRRSLRRRVPNRVTRYFSIIIIFSLVVFILTLIRASVISSRNVEAGNLGRRPPPQPEVWESFPFLTRYYGGIRSLYLSSENPQESRVSNGEENHAWQANSTIPTHNLSISARFEAYASNLPAGNTNETIQAQKCYINPESNISISPLQYYHGRPYGFPDNAMGSYKLLGLPEDICFERYGRLGPYGYGYALKYGGTGTGEDGDKEGSETVWKNSSEINQVDYRNIDWADIQRKCYNSNKARFKPEPSKMDNKETFSIFSNHHEEQKTNHSSTTLPHTRLLSRTAVVIRAWDDFEYREDDILNIRAMISELSLGSGGEYDVHILVQVKDEAANPIWADPDIYQKHLNNSVPQEFRGITTLWSVTQMLMLYQGILDTFERGPDLPVHGPYRGLQMAMQHFAYQHPEYDFFWHWEIDIRYTGHYYNLFSKIESWSANQPRKGLWERSSRFYIPSVHGTWEEFKQMVRVHSEIGTASPDKVLTSIRGAKFVQREEKLIWGPKRPQHKEDWFETENDPVPPTSYEKDTYQWGVGESADLITLNPIFNPEETTWLLAKDITGYNISDGLPDRRAAIVTTARMSKRLLLTMHRETALKKHHAFSEMWAPTVALHHGYKAVYVPHPVFLDRDWPSEYLSSVMNAGRNGATGGARTSVFGAGEHNFLGTTWYYNAGFAPNLWKRWLGLKVNNDGGAEFETTVDQSKDQKGVGGMRGGEGRMCLPPILLHPVKNTILPTEGNVEMKLEVPESDPSA
ncbi:hypothetical protein GcC1_160006 [Golovinomyces cichoracearum]|uniref:Major facilitator superfamily transporter n=1 Tax=Golovinomyces cichoracearum TaxID=62708 RepID=A0A420HU88_9PEZI|nr:hypothetical protein GcC1_160006 [Golovinomyces cichoracearum]